MVPPDSPTGSAEPADVRIAFVTAPPDKATELARTLVEERLAACVNVVPGLRSIYRWKGAVQDDPETLLVIKTAAEHVDALAERILALHPYDSPELLALAPTAGLPGYLAWVLEETSGP